MRLTLAFALCMVVARMVPAQAGYSYVKIQNKQIGGNNCVMSAYDSNNAAWLTSSKYSYASLADCEELCSAQSSCAAFVDNREASPVYCIFKTSTVTNSNTAKDTYVRQVRSSTPPPPSPHPPSPPPPKPPPPSPPPPGYPPSPPPSATSCASPLSHLPPPPKPSTFLHPRPPSPPPQPPPQIPPTFTSTPSIHPPHLTASSHPLRLHHLPPPPPPPPPPTSTATRHRLRLNLASSA
ncbi:hypothetical protein CYMTET_14930 [Cymbomonas tetramitiformis]|uniref:Apple domain-containing protein n=1 Tax=Cymbomonas tetramitiformis TaxID=36881 RepID=A0AAE0L9F2_9CHLO|nr:hypothetical protein CYMTET_14930 [Cymbomonas tetramitiformis]